MARDDKLPVLAIDGASCNTRNFFTCLFRHQWAVTVNTGTLSGKIHEKVHKIHFKIHKSCQPAEQVVCVSGIPVFKNMKKRGRSDRRHNL